MDQKPSNILLHIQELSGDSKEAFERQVLLNRLPQAVRTTLSSSEAPNNEAFGLEANRAMESWILAQNAGTRSVSAVALDYQLPQAPAVAAVASRSQAQPFLCYAHARYGARAYSCRSAKFSMRGQVQPPPMTNRQPSGKGGAGRLGGGRQ